MPSLPNAGGLRGWSENENTIEGKARFQFVNSRCHFSDTYIRKFSLHDSLSPFNLKLKNNLNLDYRESNRDRQIQSPLSMPLH